MQKPATVAPPQNAAGYWGSGWIKIGIGLLVVGAAPLLLIIVAAAVGLWPDPNPNPIGPGLLFFFTFWPAIFCIVMGVTRVRRAQRDSL